MALSWPIRVVVLVTFLAVTGDSIRSSESKAMPKKRTFLKKLNNLVSLVDRGFRSVESDIETLYGNFDLIGELATDKLLSSVRALESLKNRCKPLATTPQPDVTMLPVVTTPQPVVTTTKTEACGDRWTRYGASFFSFCKCTQKCSVNSAMNECRKKQAELAKSTSREQENFFALSLNTPYYILLGGNDRVEERTWRWPDGSLLNANYTNWRKGEPSGGRRENCLEWYAPDRKWYDTPCDLLYLAYHAGFVCEKERL